MIKFITKYVIPIKPVANIILKFILNIYLKNNDDFLDYLKYQTKNYNFYYRVGLNPKQIVAAQKTLMLSYELDRDHSFKKIKNIETVINIIRAQYKLDVKNGYWEK